MITLKDFVKDTLVQIVEATDEFAEAKKENGASANPELFLQPGESLAESGWCAGTTRGFGLIVPVEFDVAVAARDSDRTGGGAGVRILEVISVGVDTEAETIDETVSRVRFKIPLKLSNTAKGNEDY